jgi:hypothetical protein
MIRGKFSARIAMRRAMRLAWQECLLACNLEGWLAHHCCGGTAEVGNSFCHHNDPQQMSAGSDKAVGPTGRGRDASTNEHDEVCIPS